MVHPVVELKVHIFLDIFSAHLASSLRWCEAERHGDEDGPYDICQCESHGHEVEESYVR